jgi:phage gp46-like protein
VVAAAAVLRNSHWISAMQVDPCLAETTGHRRVFWTTRAAACGSYNLCGIECAIPGLEYEDIADPYPDQGLPPDGVSSGYRTIKNDEWLQGYILNILNTRSRTDAKCPTPAATYGHWSESYRDDNLYIGSTMWNAAEKHYVRIADSVRAIANAVRADMGKLVALGIAESVNVEATYRGSNSVAVVVTVYTITGQSRINLSGSFVSDTWVWQQ